MSTTVDRLPPTAEQDVGRVVADLVADGTLQATQAETLLTALHPVLAGERPSERLGVRPGLRRHAAEIAGYLGAAFVALSAVVFLSATWESYSQATRTAMLAGVALVAALIAVVVLRGRASSVEGRETRRRLAGTLLVASGLAAGLAVGLVVDEPGQVAELIGLAPLTALVVCVVGYRLAPTAIGQLGMLAASVATVMSTASARMEENLVVGGLVVLGIGVSWAVLERRGLLREHTLALSIAGLTALAGAQIVFGAAQDSTGSRVLAYALTAAVAAACLAGYASRQAWPLLVTGVLATAIVVPQVLSEWLGDSIGVPGLLLVTGLTLLGASLVGLRLGRRRDERATHDVSSGETRA
jgi:MFS family permease